MDANAKKIMDNTIVTDILFHDLIEDPPFGCTPERTIMDMLTEAGVDLVSTTVKADTYNEFGFTDLCKELYKYYLLEETFSDKVKLIYSYADILEAKQAGKLGVICSTQGSDVLGRDIRFVSIAYRLGLRIVQITYNTSCNMGCGVFEPADSGLSRLGQQMIWEMNRCGMLVDLSHVGFKTTMDAMEVSSAPVVFSHSNVKALCANKRNLVDEQIKALGKNGGVIGVCPHSVFCSDKSGYLPTVDDFINHILYIADMIGIDHVGIGTDRFVQPTVIHMMTRREFERTLPNFFGGLGVENKQVLGFNKFEDWPRLAEAMIKRGFSETDAAKVLGGNANRIFAQLWK